ncbi:MAG: triose-phosphate isomerase [Minwuiales bacterium]|nr:triose-phosphate isomerase [Minwuiales bacterium]
MNGLVKPALREVKALAKYLDKAGKSQAFDLLICPPATLIAPLRDGVAKLGQSRRIRLGGQDCHASTNGAHTGDIAAPMLKDAGCAYAIVGHSERRTDHGETDATVHAKAEAAHAAGLIAIICIGETRAERDAGQTLRVLTRQLKGSVPAAATARNTVIAYEPVWAIGTGLTPTAADVARAHAHIRKRLAARFKDAAGFRILYGGSVKGSNAAELMAVANVDGALVGGASLKATDFWPIAQAVG